jgi:hypothetical protein
MFYRYNCSNEGANLVKILANNPFRGKLEKVYKLPEIIFYGLGQTNLRIRVFCMSAVCPALNVRASSDVNHKMFV